MKLTKTKLKQLIKEELRAVLKEGRRDDPNLRTGRYTSMSDEERWEKNADVADDRPRRTYTQSNKDYTRGQIRQWIAGYAERNPEDAQDRDAFKEHMRKLLGHDQPQWLWDEYDDIFDAALSDAGIDADDNRELNADELRDLADRLEAGDY